MSIESGHVGTNTPKVDEWRDGMVEQVSEYMDMTSWSRRLRTIALAGLRPTALMR